MLQQEETMLPTPRVLLLLLLWWLLLWGTVMGMQDTRLYSSEELTQKPLSLQRRGQKLGCQRLPTSGYVCPPGWSLQEHSRMPFCLWTDHQRLPWTNASATCRSKGGDLPSTWAGRDKVMHDLMMVHGYDIMWERNNGQFGPACDVHVASPKVREMPQRFMCSLSLPFMCVRNPDCMLGKWGPGCAYQCHCLDAGEACRDKCSSGCQAGWTGDHCCSRKEAAVLAYYCIKEQFGQVLTLHLHTKTSYEVLQPVDAWGQPQHWCSPVSLAVHNFSYIITIPVRTFSFNRSSCGRETTGANSYKWRLSLQEKAGLRLPYDRTFVLACDFDNANTTIENREDTSYTVPPQQVQVLEPMTEDVDLEVVNPETDEALQEVELGKTVILRMRLNVSKDNLRAEGVSPYSCSAASTDGKVIRHLTDSRGCAVPDSPVSSFQGSNGTVRTRRFSLFSLPGHSTITVHCRLRFCFTPSQLLCDDRCSLLSRQAGRGRRQAGRGRRQAGRGRRQAGRGRRQAGRGRRQAGRGRRQAGGQGVMVVAKVHVLPDAGSRRSRHVHFSDGSHLHADMMTPVTWFLVIILLVLSGALVYMLYFCPNRRANSRVGKLRM